MNWIMHIHSFYEKLFLLFQFSLYFLTNGILYWTNVITNVIDDNDVNWKGRKSENVLLIDIFSFGS